MFCPNCGNQLPDGSKFCGHCGASLPAAVPPAPTPAPAPKKKKGKTGLIVALIAIVVVLALAAAAFFLWLQPTFLSDEAKYDKALDAAEAAMDDEDYKTAVAEYKTALGFAADDAQKLTAYLGRAEANMAAEEYEAAVKDYESALELDEDQEKTWAQLADAYVALEDTKMAIDVLNEGYEVTEDDDLLEQIEEIEAAAEEGEAETEDTNEPEPAEPESPPAGAPAESEDLPAAAPEEPEPVEPAPAEPAEPELPAEPEPPVEPERTSVVFGICPDFAPFEYLDDYGNPAGTNIDLAILFCEAYGYEPVFREFEFSTLEVALEAGEIDVIASAISYTDDRAERMLTSERYFNDAPMLLTLPDSFVQSRDDLSSALIATTDSYGGQSIDALEILGYAYTRCEENPVAVDLLLAGEVDVFVTDAVSAVYYAYNYGLTCIGTLDDSLDFEYCFYVADGNEDLLDEINASLDVLLEDDGAMMQELILKHVMR